MDLGHRDAGLAAEAAIVAAPRRARAPLLVSIAAVGIERCRLIELPVVEDPFGDLAFAEAGRHVPFAIERVFYVQGVPEEAVRGGHAHRTLEQVVFCLAGGFEIVVDDDARSRPYRLEPGGTGLYLPPMVWHDMSDFADATAYVALTSARFEESDYIRDRDEFGEAVGAAAARSAAPDPSAA